MPVLLACQAGARAVGGLAGVGTLRVGGYTLSLLAQIRRRFGHAGRPRPEREAAEVVPFTPEEAQRYVDESSREWRDAGVTRQQLDEMTRQQLARPDVQAQLRETMTESELMARAFFEKESRHLSRPH